MTRTTAILSIVLALIAGVALAGISTRIVAPVSGVFTDDRNNPIASKWTDPDTGCDYLIRGDTMNPRLKADGMPYCPGL